MTERELERLAGGEGVSIALLADLRIELARGNRFCRRDEIRWEGIPNDRPRLDDRCHRVRARLDRRICHLPSRRCPVHGRG